jgi:hypothetical protein
MAKKPRDPAHIYSEPASDRGKTLSARPGTIVEKHRPALERAIAMSAAYREANDPPVEKDPDA